VRLNLDAQPMALGVVNASSLSALCRTIVAKVNSG